MGIATWLGLFALYQVTSPVVFWSITLAFVTALWLYTSGNTLRRKVAIATWDPPSTCEIFAKQTIDMTKAQEYMKGSSEKLTVTHLVVKAVGQVFRRCPGLNGRIVLGSFVKNPTIDVCVLASTEDGKNVAPITIREVDKKTVTDISRELRERTGALRSNKDEEFKKNMDTVRMLPTFLLKPLSSIVGMITGELGISIPPLGLKARPFGGAMVTNVGMFGVEEAYAPFTPFAVQPMLLLIGQIREEPVVRDGKVEIVPQVKLMYTLDHRYLDGSDGAQAAKYLCEYLENPQLLDQPLSK